MACVYIAVQNSEEEVRVALDQLPRDASDILDIPKAEQAHLDLWLIIAREYFKQGKIEQFRQILEEGSSPEIDEYYANVRYERIALLNALGAYYTYLGKIGTKQREKEEHFILATQYYNKASRIDMHEPSTWVEKVDIGKGNWDYYAALRNEKRAPKLEATHLEKAKELYTRAHEAASGSVFVPMPDVWINLALVYFAQGNFALAVKMYQNCLQKFYYNTDAQILLYIACTHNEAEQWQDCKKTLPRGIHLAPSNYTLRFDAGVTLQKFSAFTLQKTKRTADELSAASNLQLHGLDEKKINTHVEYYKHLLDAAKVHCEEAEREEQQNQQRQEAAVRLHWPRKPAIRPKKRNIWSAMQNLERRKQEDEQKLLRQQEEHFLHAKEQWSSTTASKRRERSENDYDDGGHSEKRGRKGGKRRKDNSTRSHYETEEAEADVMDYPKELEDEDSSMNYREPMHQMNEQDDVEENALNQLAAAGLEDSDVDNEMAGPSSSAAQRRQALSESEEEEHLERQTRSSPVRENSADGQDSDGGGAAFDDDD